MNTATQHTDTNSLSDDLLKNIRLKHQEIIRVTHARLIELFHTIGKELRQGNGKNSPTDTIGELHLLSLNLVKNYGSFFTARQLNLMMQLAIQFRDTTLVGQIASILSWEHIECLLRVEREEEKLFYFRIIIEQQLSIKKLKEKISEKIFDKWMQKRKDNKTSQAKKKESYKSYHNALLQIIAIGIAQQIQAKILIKNPFKTPLLSSFQVLLHPLKGQVVTSSKNKKKSGRLDNLYGVISGHIEQYRFKHNQWLSFQLNMCLWEMGNRINREISNTRIKKNEQNSFIRKVALHVNKSGNYHFSEKKLRIMTKFAEELNDPIIVISIAQMISWGHIELLVSLKDPEMMIFFAQMAASQKLTINGLKKEIAKSVHQQLNQIDKQERKIIAMEEPSAKKNVVKHKGNTIMNTTTTYHYFDVPIQVPSIFKNSTFSHLFVSN